MKTSLKKAVAIFLLVIIAVSGSMRLLGFIGLLGECAAASFLPLEYVTYKGFFALFFLSLLLFPIKMLIGEKMSGFSYGTLAAVSATVFIGSAVFYAFAENKLSDFDYIDYPPYIEEWDTKTVREEFSCDYMEKKKVYIEGYFDFLGSSFRPGVRVEVVKDAAYSSSVGIKVDYKGDDSRIFVNDYEIIDENGDNCLKRSLSVWTIDYDDELTDEDYIYMYKYGKNFRYGDRLAVDKITVYTAYPEQIDTSGVETW